MAGLVLAWVVDPMTAQQVVGMITGMGGSFEIFLILYLFLSLIFIRR
jgi:hypothetical protein